MINLELSKKHEETFGQVMMLAEHMMRPYSRKYDKEEHTYPKEMEEVSKLIGGARSSVAGGKRAPTPEGEVVNGGNMGAVVGLFGLCWGDVGLFLGMPGSGLGNSAISAVGTPEQVEKFGGSYAAMCITEPARAQTLPISAPPRWRMVTSGFSTEKRSTLPTASAATPW